MLLTKVLNQQLVKSIMVKSMQVLIPISGYTDFFKKNDNYFPKPLIDVAGSPMIERVVENIKDEFDDPHFIFIVDRSDVIQFSLDSTLRLLGGINTKIIERSAKTSGALCSCLLGIDSLDLNSPLVIVNSDQVIENGIKDSISLFQSQECSAGVITFKSIHPRWSYVVEDNTGLVVQAVEKKVVSRNAIAGFYYFKSADGFIEAAKNVIIKNAELDGLFYISSALNELILAGEKVCQYKIDSKYYHSFYAPSKVDDFARSITIQKDNSYSSDQTSINLIIPAAGKGSRFSIAGWKKPKPFIDVNGKMMIEHVINNLISTKTRVTVLLNKNHIDEHPNIINKMNSYNAKIVPVDQVTEGTACTVLLARSNFQDNNLLLVANSDQLVDFDVNEYLNDCITRDLDGSILVFRDPSRNPKWSFAKIDSNGLVTEVAEKNQYLIWLQ